MRYPQRDSAVVASGDSENKKSECLNLVTIYITLANIPAAESISAC